MDHRYPWQAGDEGPEHEYPAGSDPCSTPRFTLHIRAAILVADGREFFCVVRDVSESGLRIRLFSPLPEHKSLLVEMSNCDRYPVELVWSTEEYAGFRFTEDVDIARLLDESHGSHPKPQVRLQTPLDAVLHSGGETLPITVQGISPQGACIESDKWLLRNELVRIETGVNPPIYAKVRWRSHPRYGVIFEQTFQLDEPARIAAPAQLNETSQPQEDAARKGAA